MLFKSNIKKDTRRTAMWSTMANIFSHILYQNTLHIYNFKTLNERFYGNKCRINQSGLEPGNKLSRHSYASYRLYPRIHPTDNDLFYSNILPHPKGFFSFREGKCTYRHKNYIRCFV